jgi:hypothetical protein
MSNEFAFKRIVDTFRELNNQKRNDNLIYGTIETLNPLSVRISDDIVIPESFLHLGQYCRPMKVTIPHVHVSAGREIPEVMTIEIDPPLQVGDRVLIFLFNNEQKFYIAEKILDTSFEIKVLSVDTGGI